MIYKIESFQLLTIREKEIFGLIVENHSTSQIAEKLTVSYETIKSHRKNIYSKLEVGGIVDLMNFYHALEK
jgi:DNA-binding CsgD family transcriptional regulator